jgi:hypothetical protein
MMGTQYWKKLTNIWFNGEVNIEFKLFLTSDITLRLTIYLSIRYSEIIMEMNPDTTVKI